MSNAWLNNLALPGMGSPLTSSEVAFLWGPADWVLLKSIQLDAATVDARNTPTTHLSQGLVLGKLSATDEWTHYSATATDGSQFAEGVLFMPVNMLDPLTAAAANKVCPMMVAGPVKAAGLGGIDQQARANMFGRFIFDDDLVGNQMGWRQVEAKTANYTVVAADNNKIFTNQGAGGAVTFTLPTIAKGLRFRFFVEAGQNVTIASAVADTLVVFNDAAADSITFSTAGELIGGAIEVIANADATKWLVFVHLGAETQTPTIAT